jgi:hypothetical protein
MTNGSIHMKKSRIDSLKTLMLAASLIGCGSTAKSTQTETESDVSQDSLDGIPELGAVQMALTEDAAEAVATSDDRVASPSVAEAANAEESMADFEELQLPEAAQELRHMQRPIRALNQALRAFLHPIAYLVKHRAPNAQIGRVQLWGPIRINETEYRLLARQTVAKHHTGWRLDARAVGDKAYIRVAAGELTAGDVVRRGHGAMGVDLDALSSVAKEVKAQGQLLLGFRHRGAAATVAYGLRNFTPDATKHDPIDAVVRGIKRDDGIRKVRLAFHGNWEASATDKQELVLGRARQNPGIGGRADALVLAGDIPKGTLLYVSECWDHAEQSAFRVVRNCEFEELKLGSCNIEKEVGDPDACDSSLQDPEVPSLDANNSDADPDDPEEDVTVPNAMPEFDDE